MTDDLREIPAYTLTDAAHYLRVPSNTLSRWVMGYSFASKSGTGHSRPLIKIAAKNPNLLSFYNLVEAHVLCALRRKHGIRMNKVRKALEYLKRTAPSPHPFADYWFETDGVEILLEKVDALESISQQGQLAMRGLLAEYLQRIERDEQKFALRLFPFTKYPPADDSRLIVIDPAVSFGRPVIAGSGVPTAIIAERWAAGESIEELMDDYARSAQEIQEALRCELRRHAA